MDYIAHIQNIDNNVCTQSLSEHLINVGDLAAKTASKIDLQHSAFLLGICHDLGKYGSDFQNYIKNNTNQHVNHSSSGGIYLYYKVAKLLHKNMTREERQDYGKIAEILAYVIFAHHGFFDLIDFNSDEIDGFTRRMGQKANDYEKQVAIFETEITPLLEQREYKSIDNLIDLSVTEMKSILRKINQMALEEQEIHYYLHCLVRLLLSILKDADIYDSANAFLGVKMPIYSQNECEVFFEQGLDNIERQYQEYDKVKNKKEINIVRSELSAIAKAKAVDLKLGLVTANLPTGSGKTLLTTRFALANALGRYKKDRIFYITAFLSVLEQNAKEIKAFFAESELLLEHHSNLIIDRREDDDDKEYILNDYLTNSWSAPFILTTMVQYANTEFKGKSANIRRFCKLINSVIVIDEIQSMPLKMTYLHNLMTNFLTQIMGAVVVHTTATQPRLDSPHLKHKVIFNHQQELTALREEQHKLFERTRQYYLQTEDVKGFNLESLSGDIVKKISNKNSILIILNTKSAVSELYQNLIDFNLENIDFIQLTTNKTANHRLREVAEIKEKLAVIKSGESKRKIICISTALIEAGVDVDFEVVYRSMAPVPSLIQSIGRCNREGSLDYGEFFVFDYQNENIQMLKEVFAGTKIARTILGEDAGNRIFIDTIKDDYYDKLYQNNQNELYFNTEKNGKPIFELLTSNQSNRSEFKQIQTTGFKHFLAQNFKSAANLFEFIDDNSATVIVEYGEVFDEIDTNSYKQNQSLIAELETAYRKDDFASFKQLIKALQTYTIAVRNINSIERFIRKVGDVYILNSANYDVEQGLNCSELELLLF